MAVQSRFTDWDPGCFVVSGRHYPFLDLPTSLVVSEMG